MKTVNELWELYEQARTLPHGAAQIALVEELLRHADTVNDPHLAFTVRLLATNAYIYGGEPAKAFVTFAWTLNDFDRNPGRHHEHGKHTLLWHFKAMVNAMLNFPEIPLMRTRAVLDDMERRYREDGHSLQAVYKHRYLVAEHLGDTADADEWFARWQAAPRDDLSDCIGCDPSSVAAYYNERGRPSEVVATAEPVLAGELSCSEQPQGILRELMVAYLRTGRPDEAADAHRRSYRLERGNLADLWNLGTHLAFCARTGNEHRGLEILQRHIDWLDKAPSPAADMHFSSDAAMLLRRLTELGHGEAVVRRREHGDISAADLATELSARATALAERFDARNGNDHQSRSIAAGLTAEPYETVLTLSPTARPAPVSVPPPPVVAEPAPEVPAEATAAELLDLARQHDQADRDAATDAVLAALDARFPQLDEPLLAAQRELLLGNRLRSSGREDDHHWSRALELFTEAGATGEASALRARLAMAVGYAGGEVDEAPIRADLTYQQQHGGPREQAYAWARLSILHLMNDRPDEANEAGDRGDECALRTGDDRLVALHAMLRARSRMAAHRHDESVAAARAAWQFYREHGPVRRRAEAGVIFGHTVDEPAEQVEAFGAVLASGDPEKALPARVGRGNALLHLGRPVEAITDLAEAVALCAEAGNEIGGAYARSDLANAYRLAERPVEGAEVAEEALTLFEKAGDDEGADNTRYLLAGLYQAIGDKVGALPLYRTLIERLADNPAGRGQIAEEAAGLLFDLDRDAEAAETFRAAASALHEAGDLIGELRALRRGVAALHFSDQPEQGEETLRLIYEKFDTLPAELAVEPNAIFQRSMTAFEAGNLLMSRGRYVEALPHLRGIPERLQAIGATDQADRIEGMLGEALFRAGHEVEAEALLRALLERMPADGPSRDIAARVHDEARAALEGRSTS
ncbi:tetratricopeptide repeat protein [Actinoplanes sp. TRM 88003]|uniref:Tetratricopeptide repeat protein n=1 Tax=Paractinoplanes aksuensis TaxID=2939490 RepID=A0ABT1E3B9_9ACTN|nr:tetratricopeptide repeat protein [Actinoplanes aksuensis]MCO8277598.1 tetratricopeptide repeat protein [Actinoplanes aksuensis]